MAGPFGPPAGAPGSPAIPLDHPDIDGWATEVVVYEPGVEIDEVWRDTTQALGPAEGDGDSVVSLGRGGAITLRFDQPFIAGQGWDFAIFENSFSDDFLELAYVEVSEDGERFFRFPGVSLTPHPVSAFGRVDVTNVRNLAGVFRQGFGTPFNLNELDGLLDIHNIRYVRLLDVVGDGSMPDSAGRPIYDPYPTVGSAGFDLDAVARRSEVRTPGGPPDPLDPPDSGDPLDPDEESGSAGIGGGCVIAADGDIWGSPLLWMLVVFGCWRTVRRKS